MAFLEIKALGGCKADSLRGKARGRQISAKDPSLQVNVITTISKLPTPKSLAKLPLSLYLQSKSKPSTLCANANARLHPKPTFAPLSNA